MTIRRTDNSSQQHQETNRTQRNRQQEGVNLEDSDAEMNEISDSPESNSVPQGSAQQLKSIPQAARQDLLQQAQMFGYAEVTLPNGQTVWFSSNQVFSEFGTPQQKAMSGSANLPGPKQPQMQGPQGNTGGRGSIVGPGGSEEFIGNNAGYANMGNGYGGGYGNYGGMSQNQFMWDMMVGGQQKSENYAMMSNMRKAEHQLKIKMRMIMFLVMMGDVVGAMRQMVFESEKMNRMFNRTLVKQLNRVRQAKSKILMAMGRKRPPTAHDNTNNAAGAARDQNKQAKYTQWVSVTTQLMSEVQQTERELMDLMSEARRNINELWESYSGFKEAEARTTRTVIQAFRS
ncbi:MAG: hypothetical protein JNK65_06415 [Deltaproteobacteria bacterium]|nr:hypothetical protein [Deltaproteobacteria bacterium]